MKRKIVHSNKNWRETHKIKFIRRPTTGTWDFKKNDWFPSEGSDNFSELRVLDIKEYDPVILDKNFKTARPYEFFDGDLNKVGENKVRNERLSPELNIDSVPILDDKFMLVENKTYRVYFDYIATIPHENDEFFDFDGRYYHISPTAKALNYGFIMQSPVMIERNYNPVIPFYDNVLGYVISTNLFTPVTVNIPKGTILAHFIQFKERHKR